MTSSPKVFALIVPVALDDWPVIVSPTVKTPFLETKLNGLVVLIILAVAPVEPPVIISPLVNVPETPVTVNVGATASELDCESKTATKLNTSARPRDIVLSVDLIPKAPSSSVSNTLSCFIKLVVLVFCVTEVFNIVAVSFTFAESPKIVLSVTVNAPLPVPDSLPDKLTISP